MGGRYCTVCQHEKRQEIDEALIAGVSGAKIAKRFGLAATSILRHRRNHLVPDLINGEERIVAAQRAIAAQDDDPNRVEPIYKPAHKPVCSLAQSAAAAVREVSLAAIMRSVLARTEKVIEACEEELRHPNDPEAYFFGPHARDLKVAWRRAEEGEVIKGVSTLQGLLDEVQAGTEKQAGLVETKYADPRELLLKALKATSQSLDVVARHAGPGKEATAVTTTPAWHQIKQVLITKLASHPALRAEIMKELRNIAADVSR